MHEIITLQLGQRANYLATHFWNTQESYFTYSAEEESLVDHDIHFRPGIGADGTETFTPRTVIYDLKGGFGSLRKINALYEMEEEKDPMAHGLWNGPTVVQRQAPIEQSAYQQSLEEGSSPPQLTTNTVRYWSDFNRVYFHPRSIVQLNEYELNSSLMPFENWEAGEELFSNLDKEHDLVDRDLRPFVEEADQMQGIQIMASVDDAWGGFAAKYMDRLRDEYGKTTIWVWALEDSLAGTPRDKQRLKLANSAKSLSEISPLASLYVPMTIPATAAMPSYVHLDRRSVWHASALLSTAMESITLPSRLKAQNGVRQSLDDIAASLNVNGNQNIAKLRMSVAPASEVNGTSKAHISPTNGTNGNSDMRLPTHERLNAYASFEDHTKDNKKNDLEVLDIDFFPSEEFNQARGRILGKKPHVFGQAEISRANPNSSTPVPTNEEDDGQERARRRAAGLPVVNRTFTPMGFPLLDSFPNIFEYDSPVSVQTSLSTDTTITSRVKSLQDIVARSIGLDEREALSNCLGEIAEAYEEGYSSGSDEDEDDD